MESVAILFAEAGIARWSATGSYPSGVLPPIFIRAVPETPDTLISLATYTVQPATTPDDEILGLQVFVRGGADPRAVDEIQEKVRGLLHNRRGPLGKALVSLCLLQSGASLGQDGSGRWAWSANYYIRIARPTPHFP